MNHTTAKTGFLSLMFGLALLALGGTAAAGHCNEAAVQGADALDWHAIMFLDQ